METATSSSPSHQQSATEVAGRRTVSKTLNKSTDSVGDSDQQQQPQQQKAQQSAAGVARHSTLSKTLNKSADSVGDSDQQQQPQQHQPHQSASGVAQHRTISKTLNKSADSVGDSDQQQPPQQQQPQQSASGVAGHRTPSKTLNKSADHFVGDSDQLQQQQPQQSVITAGLTRLVTKKRKISSDGNRNTSQQQSNTGDTAELGPGSKKLKTKKVSFKPAVTIKDYFTFDTPAAKANMCGSGNLKECTSLSCLSALIGAQAVTTSVLHLPTRKTITDFYNNLGSAAGCCASRFMLSKTDMLTLQRNQCLSDNVCTIILILVNFWLFYLTLL